MISNVTLNGPPIARRDIAIAVLFSVLGVAVVGWAQDGANGGLAPGDPLTGLLILPAVVPVLWRRRAPLLAVAATIAGTAIHIAAYGTIGRCGLLLPLAFVEAFAAASLLDRRKALYGLVLALGSGVVCLSADSTARWGGLTISVPVTVAVWFIGRVVRSRARMAARLRDHNTELSLQREANARLVVESDRVRLSAELDGLLRSRLVELTRLAEAGAAGYADATPALARIEAESRATLEQMRVVLGLLRDEDGPTTEPQPTLAHLDALVVREKGPDARVTVTGHPRALPAALELTAFRVVEHLLNATGDAPGVEVHVSFQADALELTVSGPSRGSRRRAEALDLARQRLQLHRGRLDAESAGGRTRLTAAIPMYATA